MKAIDDDKHMTEKELGSFNVCFEMKNFEMKDELIKTGMEELGFRAGNLITKSGIYALKIIVTEIELNHDIA